MNLQRSLTRMRSTLQPTATFASALLLLIIPVSSSLAEELIVNGGFEAQSLSGWSTQQNVPIDAQTQIFNNDGTLDPAGPEGPLAPCSGSFSALFGQQPPVTQTLYQDISIPSRLRRATLSWTDQIRSQSPFVAGSQEFRAEIRTTNNQLLRLLYQTDPNNQNTLSNCSQRSFNLFEFRGQTIRIAFEVVAQNAAFNLQIDDVSADITYLTSSPPSISAIKDHTVFGRTILGFGAPVLGPLAFEVDDLHTPAGDLHVVARSDNQTMIEDQDLLISGSGSRRFISVTDIGHVGTVANITITVTDGQNESSSTTFSVTSFSGNSVLVDNRSAGFSSTGRWTESAAIDEFSGSSFVSEENNSTATFTPMLPSIGDYQVFVWWANELENGRTAFRASAVNYFIHHANGTELVRLDQRAQSGTWVPLGTYPFAATGNESVLITGITNGSLNVMNVDAIAFVASGSASFVDDVIVDEQDPGFTQSEGWHESGVINEFRDHSLSTFSSFATATWTPPITTPGSYEVFLWQSRETRGGRLIQRASSVVYEISHGSATTRVVIDQNETDSANWVLLGTFDFEASGEESVKLLPGAAAYGSGSVGADAMRFSPLQRVATIDFTIDNQSSQFTAIGSWRESGALDEYDSSSIYSTSLGDTATWSFAESTAGSFEVFVWYAAALPQGRRIQRNSSARYFIHHQGIKSLSVVDQNTRSGEWISLGKFDFDALGEEGVTLHASGQSTSADAVRFIRSN